MILDAHTHIGFGKLITAKPKQLIASLNNARIDGAIVFAGDINACPTEKLLKEITVYRKKLFPVGSVSPYSDKKPSFVKIERWLKERKIYGLKFYPGYESFYPYDAVVEPYLKILERFRQPAVFHTGDTYNIAEGARLRFAMPLHIDEIAVRHPNLPIIIAHMGNPWLLDGAEVAFKNDNVYYDCSGWVYGAFKAADRAHFRRRLGEIRGYTGSFKKMLFGTDWPVSNQKSYVAFIQSLPFRRKERAMILAQNAIDIFRIPIKI